jgi:hypothetical protein
VQDAINSKIICTFAPVFMFFDLRKGYNDMMKVRLFLYVFVGLLAFSGCSKDEHFENHQTTQSHEFKLKKTTLQPIIELASTRSTLIPIWP